MHDGLVGRATSDAAHLLAAREWPRLYDPDRLAQNDVPTAAVVYADDMYVNRALSEGTADRVRDLRVWATDEYEHNGLTADGERVLDHLIGLVRGV